MRDLRPDSWAAPCVVLVGVGMGMGDISTMALRWIERAEVLAGGARHLDWFARHPGEKLPLKGPLNAWMDAVADISRERRTVVLASGDPFFFGIGRRLAERLGKEHLVTFPNITSVQVLFARLNESWEDVKVLSLHGRGSAVDDFRWLLHLRLHPRCVCFTDPQHTPDWIARQLLENGLEDRVMVVGEDLGTSSERIHRLSPRDAAAGSFSSLNLVAVFAEREEPPRQGTHQETASSSGDLGGDAALPRTVLGLPESAFRHQAGLITKMEVRAVALAALQLEPGLVLWDLGAGSGSVSIEASRLVPLRYVAAVEKDPHRYRDLRRTSNAFVAPPSRHFTAGLRNCWGGCRTPTGFLSEAVAGTCPRYSITFCDGCVRGGGWCSPP
jgi:precorrin-6B C5,15-methyltransferase / cobalt-precorrin-6B C5,C15-methyltransferase